MKSSLSYASKDAVALQKLAALVANEAVSAITFIPGWSIITTVGPSFYGTQALIVTGALPSTGNEIAVLVLGQSWSGILNNYNYEGPKSNGPYQPDGLNARLTPASCSGAQFVQLYQTQYLKQLEPDIFTELKRPAIIAQLQGKPLIVTGQAQAAPLAQLAALGFRSSRTGLPPNSPNTAACYSFSTPALGNQEFASCLLKTIPATFNVYVSNVDFFAAPPNTLPAGVATWPPAHQPVPLVAAGTCEAITASVPALSDPWWAQGGAYYQSLLSNTKPPDVTPGSVTPSRPGYQPDLAYVLAQISAQAYRAAEHPNLVHPILAYDSGELIYSDDKKCWGIIFSNRTLNRVVVAFRGEISYYDIASTDTPLGVITPSYLPGTGGNLPIFQGPGFIYSGNTTIKGSVGLRADLRTKVDAALKKLPSTPRQLILTGHSAGGTLANIAAMDLFNDHSGDLVAPTAVYTFGAPPTGPPQFNAVFDSNFSSNSYQLSRPKDPFPSLGFNDQVGAAVTLNGAMPSINGVPMDALDQHSLFGFVQLLKT